MEKASFDFLPQSTESRSIKSDAKPDPGHDGHDVGDGGGDDEDLFLHQMHERPRTPENSRGTSFSRANLAEA